MTIESAVSITSYFGQYEKNVALYEIAKALSGFDNIDIIDSYSPSSTPQRFVGDPVDNGSWASSSDVGGLNSWMVFEPSSPVVAPYPANPKWQAKLQCHNRYAGGWDDPSGKDYNFEGLNDFHTVCIRYSPFGGWNTATYDFDFGGVDPTTQVTYNFKIRHYNGSGHYNRFLLTCDEDTLIGLVHVLGAPFPLLLMFYLGEYVPKSPSQGPPSRMALVRDGSAELDNFVTGFLPHAGSTAENLFIVDKNDVLLSGPNTQSVQTNADLTSALTRESQPNRFDTDKGLDLLPVMMKVTSESMGVAGSLRGIWRAYGCGKLTPIDGYNLVTSTYGFGHAIMWDNSVEIG